MELKEIAEEIKAEGVQCNCDLDKWEPNRDTWHSHVCRIDRLARERCRNQRSRMMNTETLDRGADEFLYDYIIRLWKNKDFSKGQKLDAIVQEADNDKAENE